MKIDFETRLGFEVAQGPFDNNNLSDVIMTKDESIINVLKVYNGLCDGA